MAKRLQDKVAIITGGGTGIGAATAERFAEEGARVVVVMGRRIEPLNEVVERIRATGAEAVAMSVDVSEEQQFEDAIREVKERYGRVDILVNNAVSVVSGMIEKLSTSHWHANFRATLDGTFFGTRAVFPIMRKQGGGVIVNVSSVCGLLGTFMMAGYTAAKAGVINFTRTAALEGAPHNIRVNCVVPGAVLTPPTIAVNPDERSMQATANAIPLKRIGDPRELANAILFMASDESSYITGQPLVVDGGKTIELSAGSTDFSKS